MVNEDIITALNNSLERGESLDDAMQILINTGYNPNEINEASNFFKKGVISIQEAKEDEKLIMPNSRRFSLRLFNKKKSLKKKQNEIIKNKVLNKKSKKSLEEIRRIKQEVSKGNQIIEKPAPQEFIQNSIQESIQRSTSEPIQRSTSEPIQRSASEPVKESFERNNLDADNFFEPPKNFPMISAPRLKEDSESFSQQISKVKKTKKSHRKEIILLIILLFLISIFVTTMIFKYKVLNLFP